jgi:hypothetical protein
MESASTDPASVANTLASNNLRSILLSKMNKNLNIHIGY